MSAVSSWYCLRCRLETTECKCEGADDIESIANFVMRREPPPQDHPWFDTRPEMRKFFVAPTGARKGNQVD